MNYLDNISIELYNILDLLLKNIRNIYHVKNDEYINNNFILIFHFYFYLNLY